MDEPVSPHLDALGKEAGELPGAASSGLCNHHISLCRVIRIGSKWSVIVDGKGGPTYDGTGITGPVFSPDGAHVAYAGKTDGKWSVVVDGQEGPIFDAIPCGPTFRPDGLIEYIAGRDDILLRIICSLSQASSTELSPAGHQPLTRSSRPSQDSVPRSHYFQGIWSLDALNSLLKKAALS